MPSRHRTEDRRTRRNKGRTLQGENVVIRRTVIDERDREREDIKKETTREEHDKTEIKRERENLDFRCVFG